MRLRDRAESSGNLEEGSWFGKKSQSFLGDKVLCLSSVSQVKAKGRHAQRWTDGPGNFHHCRDYRECCVGSCCMMGR